MRSQEFLVDAQRNSNVSRLFYYVLVFIFFPHSTILLCTVDTITLEEVSLDMWLIFTLIDCFNGL